VKRCIADGSVGFPHVRVGHCQALILDPAASVLRDFFMGDEKMRWRRHTACSISVAPAI
jgi:hypothetical protein